jgi:hypothetical protein
MKDLGAFVAHDDLLTLISLPASWISTKEKKYIKAGTLASVIAQASTHCMLIYLTSSSLISSS